MPTLDAISEGRLQELEELALKHNKLEYVTALRKLRKADQTTIPPPVDYKQPVAVTTATAPVVANYDNQPFDVQKQEFVDSATAFLKALEKQLEEEKDSKKVKALKKVVKTVKSALDEARELT